MNTAAQNLGFQSVGRPLDVKQGQQKVTLAVKFASTHPFIHLGVSYPETL